MDGFNLDIEVYIIGNCINSTEIFLKALDKGISSEDFYNTNNQIIFDAITQCYKAKNTTDIIRFSEFIKRNGITITNVTNIVSGTITFTDMTPYFNELINLRVTRERIKFAKEIQMGILRTDDDIEKRLKEIEFIKAKVGNDNAITTLDKVKMVDVYTLEKIPTGFDCIDKEILGFAMGSLNIITGYNGNGKSTLINQMLISESMSRGYKVFAYSPELTNSNLKSWLYPTIANDDHFINKSYKGQSYKSLGDVGIKYIDDWIMDKLYVYTDDSITSDENCLLRDMNNLAQQGVRVFIIDNLAKINLENSFKDKYMAQKVFVNKLKNFARKYNALVHLVAHPKKPQISGNTKITKFDIEGSGDITNLADYVMSISRITSKDREDNNDLLDKDAVIKIMKDRIKGSGEFYSIFKFDKDRKRFYSNYDELNKDYGYTDKLDLIQVEM